MVFWKWNVTFFITKKVCICRILSKQTDNRSVCDCTVTHQLQVQAQTWPPLVRNWIQVTQYWLFSGNRRYGDLNTLFAIFIHNTETVEALVEIEQKYTSTDQEQCKMMLDLPVMFYIINLAFFGGEVGVKEGGEGNREQLKSYMLCICVHFVWYSIALTSSPPTQRKEQFYLNYRSCITDHCLSLPNKNVDMYMGGKVKNSS